MILGTIGTMILSDRDIKKAFADGRIRMTPAPDLGEVLNDSSIDFRLGHEFRVFRSSSKAFIDVKDPKSFEELTELVRKPDGDPFVIHPGEFVLGIAFEELALPDDVAVRIDGKSSLGRLGIVLHSTAGHVGAGWQGRITLELTNIGHLPVLLYPGMRIGQYVFEQMSSPAETPYSKKGKYQGQSEPGQSKIQEELK